MLDPKIKDGLERCLSARLAFDCDKCPYDKDENGNRRSGSVCRGLLYDDLMAYIDDCENVIKLLEETT